MTRKYGQRGYQEGERREPSSRGAGAPARREPPPPKHNLDRPRGRGLGAPDQQVFRCAACGATQDPPAADAFAAVCASCGADLHACVHCSHFETSAPWECRRWQERQAAGLGAVTKKRKANECALFAAKVSVEFAQEKPADPDPDDPRAAFEALFK
jgi:hypothetical protein